MAAILPIEQTFDRHVTRLVGKLPFSGRNNELCIASVKTIGMFVNPRTENQEDGSVSCNSPGDVSREPIMRTTRMPGVCGVLGKKQCSR